MLNWQKILYEYPWDFISVLMDALNYLFIITGASLTFLYFKIRKLKIMTIGDIGGCDVIIQNISKDIVFIKSICIIVNCKDKKNKRIININDFPEKIESKSFYKVNVDYIIQEINEKDNLHIKVELYPKSFYKKRIKCNVNR